MEGRENGDLDQVILRMSRATYEIFRDGLAAFEGRDAHGARGLRVADDEVDLLYREAINLAADPVAGEDASPGWQARIPLIVHYLERIADRGWRSVNLRSSWSEESGCEARRTGDALDGVRIRWLLPASAPLGSGVAPEWRGAADEPTYDLPNKGIDGLSGRRKWSDS